MSITKRLLNGIIACLIILAAGEFTARLDDALFQNIPFTKQSDRERDLLFHEPGFIRGRSHGQFKKYQLNAWGFRGPETPRDKIPGTRRVMLLGASETFGLYESENHEFAALLRERLAPDRIEVINAAVAGMTLPSLTAYWNGWASTFHPDLVLIYPSPQFYLDNDPPASAKTDMAFNRLPRFRSRFLARLTEALKQFESVKSARAWALLKKQRRGRDASWIYRDAPPDRLDAYARDLTQLAQAVAKTGARPILITHAVKSVPPLTAADLRQLKIFQLFFPRAEPEVIIQFDLDAAQKTVDIGCARKWPVIDASSVLSGRREYFADPTHYNDAGSAAMADLLIPEIRRAL